MTNTNLPKRAQEVYDFWFYPGCIDELVQVLKQGKRLWWHSKDASVDKHIVDNFAGDLARVSSGEYDDWLATPDGMLAYTILIDQFPRHIYRGDPRAFAFDTRALATTRKGIAKGFDKQLEPVHRYFFYLPFMHSQDLEVQRQASVMYEEVHRTAPEPLKLGLGLVRDAAKRHREIIERFGRFPHRNEAMGLTSTPEEIEFLKEPHSSF